MLTKFFVVVLVVVGLGVLWIEYGRQEATTETATTETATTETATTETATTETATTEDAITEDVAEEIAETSDAPVLAGGDLTEENVIAFAEAGAATVGEGEGADASIQQEEMETVVDDISTDLSDVAAASGTTPDGTSSPVLASGVWTEKNYSAEGTWQVVQEGDETYVELDAAFATNSAPDLKLFLSPQKLDDLTDANATQDSVLVSPLASNQGAQKYVLPSDIDLDNFETVIIHCEQFSKLWSGASLK